jgi:anti-sigma factor RsiW
MSEMSRNPELLSCREMVRMFTDYLEDVLPLQERLRFEEHLSLCDGCTGYLDQIRDVVRTSRGLSDEQLPEPLRDEFLRTFAIWKGQRAT